LKAGLLALVVATATAQPVCDKPVYLTFDTGHMGVAPLVAQTLKRHNAKATFFLASEPTQTGGTTLDDNWTPWWRERAAEGHDFGAHTWDHDVFLQDIPDADGRITRFKFRTQAGIQPPVVRELTAEQYCASLKKVGDRFMAMTVAGAAERREGLRLRSCRLGPRGLPRRRTAQRHPSQRPAAGEGAARHPAGRHPRRASRYLGAPGPVGARGAGAADGGP
jgi:hypothetical protein